MPVFVRNRTSDECTAYAYANMSSAMSGGDLSRCLLWFDDLVDMGKYLHMDGEDLYLQLADSPPGKRQKKRVEKRKMLQYLSSTIEAEAGDKNSLEFPFIKFEIIAEATADFSDSNIIGQGGFGKVYKTM
ncbi:hypothetical protein U9M48_033968 [Paspalum notatum var. saurae]|uniref:Apple domain-containing protein n=1 Tax=Paspalum notatum var. saurae TaxID=547442 RepID=A0AAQ3X7C2_PASNO